MNTKIYQADRVLLGMLVVLAFTLQLTTEAQAAKRGWYVGGGSAASSVTEGLEGDGCYSRNNSCTNTVVVYPGKLEPGGGLALQAGFRFSEGFSLDYFTATTTHEAEHEAFAGETQEVGLFSGLLGPRFHFLMFGDVELFFRLGIGWYAVEYMNAAKVSGKSGLEKASFQGQGYGFGTGLEIFFDQIGLEFGYTQQNASLDTLTAGNEESSIDALEITFVSTNLSVLYHFGN